MADKITDSLVEELRRSFEHILIPEFNSLQDEIRHIHELIDQLEKTSHPLTDELQKAKTMLRELENRSSNFDQQINQIHRNLTEPEQITGLVKIGLRPALQQEISKSPIVYGKIISPVISRAITDQIKNSRAEMVEALHPIIGQTIQSAISEAFNDLRRKIDSSMSQSMNIGTLAQRARGRARGLSASEQIIRDALDYKVTHVFLIHRETGLLLGQATRTEVKEDLDLIGSLLTAIRDFTQDTFGSKEDELEDIQYGKAHICIKSGSMAYIAAVVEGILPSGFTSLLQRAIYQINHEKNDELTLFSGEMADPSEYQSYLSPLLNPTIEDLSGDNTKEALSKNQKIGIGFGILAIILVIGLTIFACNFSIRLLPLAYPAPTNTVTPSPAPTMTATLTPTLTATPTPLPTLTITPTQINPTSTPAPIMGVTTGNVYSRKSPSLTVSAYPAALLVNTPVEILEVQGTWVRISWLDKTGRVEGWVPLIYIQVPNGIPESIINP